MAEAVPRCGHLRRDPAQGRHAVEREHRRDQQGPERADLRVLRPRHRRRPQQDPAQADRRREGEEGGLTLVPPVLPLDYAPDVKPPEEFVGPPTDPEDERIEVGVVIVGGGPAGLSCAIRLTQLLEEEPALAESLGEVPVALVEKGKTTGSHLLSGAMMEPSAMRRLFPDLDESDWPTFGTVDTDALYFLTKRRAIPLKPTPPPFRNHGNHVTSIAQLGRFLGEKAEEAGVYILPETSGYKLLVDDGKVVGVRTGDKGRGRDGEELSNFEPGSDVMAKATALCEGTQGHLTGAAIRYFDLSKGADPPQWELGVKEIWEVPKPLDKVVHTMGWPLRPSAK